MNPTTRLTLSMLMLIAVAGMSGCSNLDGTAGTVYVTNEISGDLSVIDVATERVVATIPLGKRPRGLRASPDGTLLYVALSGSPIAGPGVDESKLPPPDKRADGIGIVDLRARRLLKVLPSGSDPEQLDVSADGKLLFVANEDTGQASVVDATSGALVATMKVGGEPEGVNIRPDGKEVYVTSEQDSTVSVIDATAPRVLLTIPVGPRPRSTTFLRDSSRAFIPSENGGSVDVIDTTTHQLIARVPLSGELQRPMGGVASHDGKFVYMSTGRGKTVAIIDVEQNRHVGSIEAGDRPWGIAISTDDKWLFTANGPSHDVSIIDVSRRTVKARVKAGEGPWGALFLPAWVVRGKSNLCGYSGRLFRPSRRGVWMRSSTSLAAAARCSRSPLSSWLRKESVRRKAEVGLHPFPHNSVLRVIQR